MSFAQTVSLSVRSGSQPHPDLVRVYEANDVLHADNPMQSEAFQECGLCPLQCGEDSLGSRVHARERTEVTPIAGSVQRAARHSGQSEGVDSVTLGNGERTLTLTRGNPPDLGDPYSGGNFGADLRAPGLSAARQVFIYGWSDLAGFFSDLAANWHGWVGPKTWSSPEYDLMMTATHDSGGHVTIEIVLRDGPVHTWSVATAVNVEPGEEMARLAQLIAGVIPTTKT